jgi:hypothetical protein
MQYTGRHYKKRAHGSRSPQRWTRPRNWLSCSGSSD